MKHLISCVAVALALVPAAVWSDCVDGTRSASSEERTFARQLSESLKAALPQRRHPVSGTRTRIDHGHRMQGHAGERGWRLVMANYTASPNYSDRVKLTIRANYAFPGADDLVSAPFRRSPQA